jgi:ribosomal protein L35
MASYGQTAMKTNKSYAKRLKVTKSGTVLTRKPGQNHFNAKESRRRTQQKKKRLSTIVIPNKARSRFLINI